MSRLLKKKFLIPCALAGILVGPLSAVAAGNGKADEPPIRVVQFGDLDLSREAGIAVLYSRLHSAAREVCESSDTWSLRLFRQQTDCREAAIGRAVADVNSAALTTYYLTKSKAGGTDIRRR
jgi:UrcA family protein